MLSQPAVTAGTTQHGSKNHMQLSDGAEQAALASYKALFEMLGVVQKLLFMQNDEAEDEEMGVEESGNDGFFVSDGQLSEDEGLSSIQQDINSLCAGQEGAA